MKHLSILSILLLGFLLRFYRIRDYLVFLGDEGRDVLVVKRMLIDHELTLLGPVTSTGGMFLGPLYYYFIAPFLWLFGYDPVGPAVMVALFGVATIYLVYQTGREFFDLKTGLFAAMLFATSPLTIIYTRSSWNPNILPFFSLLIIYSLLKTIIKNQRGWLFITGMSFGVALQLHYLALFFFLVFALTPILKRGVFSFKRFILFITGVVSTFWPFILFELRHRFPNTQTIWRFVTKSGSDATLGTSNLLGRSKDILIRIFFRLVVVDSVSLAKLLLVVMVIAFVIILVRRERSYRSLLILFLWLAAGLLTYSTYRGAIYDYYFVPLFTLPFLLLGIFLSQLFRSGAKGKIVTITLVGIFLFFHFKNSPHRIEPNSLLDQSERIARFVWERTEGKPYNFALISSGNSNHAYRYFLELWGHPPTTIENEDIDPERRTVKEQLIVVCEEKKCQPLGHSLWEIAGFGRAEVAGVWDVFPVKVVRLVPYNV